VAFVDGDVLGSDEVLAVRSVDGDGELDAIGVVGAPAGLRAYRAGQTALPHLEPVTRAVVARDIAARCLRESVQFRQAGCA